MNRTKKLLVAILVLFLLSGCSKQKIVVTGDNLAPETTVAITQQEQEQTAAGTVQTTTPESEQPTAEAQSITEAGTEAQPAATQETEQRATKNESKGNGRYVFGMILLLLLSGAGLYVSYLIPKRKAERRRRARARQAAARRAQAQAPQKTPTNPLNTEPDKPVFKDGHWV